MFGSQILEVVIGMMLIYLLFSLLLTAVREVIEGWLKTRAADLERCLAEMLQDESGNGDRKRLFKHDVIFSLFAGDYDPTTFVAKPVDEKVPPAERQAAPPTEPWRPCTTRTPSYIPRELFADAIIDLYRDGALTKTAATLDSLYRSAGGDPALWRAKTMAWYDAAMDRATGWYRRRTQQLLLGLGLALALFMNVNSATLIGHLASNDVLRQQLVTQAEAQVANGSAMRPSECVATPSTDCVAALNARVQGLGLPIGWGAEGRQPWTEALQAWSSDPLTGIGQFAMLICGMFATALAISLGAPFWFDLLSKVMNVRSTLKPPSADVPAPAAARPAVAPPISESMREHDDTHNEPATQRPLVFG